MSSQEVSWFFDPLFFEEFENFYQWTLSSDCNLEWNWNAVCDFFVGRDVLDTPVYNPWERVFNFERDNFKGNRLEMLAIYSLLFIGFSDERGILINNAIVRNSSYIGFEDLSTYLRSQLRFNPELKPPILILPISNTVGENVFMITLCLLYYIFAGTPELPIVFTLSDFVNLCKQTGDWSNPNTYIQNWTSRQSEDRAKTWATLTLFRAEEPSLWYNKSLQERRDGFNWACINRRYATSIPWIWSEQEANRLRGGEFSPLVGKVVSPKNPAYQKDYRKLERKMMKALRRFPTLTFNYPLG